MKSVGECKYHVLNCFEHSLGAVEVFEEITLAEHFPNMGRKQSSKYRKLGESHIVLTQGGTC